MQDLLKRLGGQAVVYGLGYGLTRLLQFILLPIYTRYLTPADYGVYALLLVTGNIAMIVSQVGQSSAMFREVIYEATDRRTVESTVIVFLTAVTTAVFAAAWALSPALSRMMFEGADYTHLLRLVFLTAAVGIFEMVLLARLRIEQKPGLYTLLALGRFVIGAGLTVYFLVVLKRGLAGLVEATLITTVLFAVIYLAILARGLRPTFSTAVLRRLLRFGGPLVPGNLAGISMTSADRYILQHFGTTAQVGIYALGYNVSLILNLFINAVQLAWPAHMFAIAREADAESRLARMLTYYTLTVGFAALVISVWAREIVWLMSTPDFFDAARVVPLICLAYLFYGMSFMVNSGLETRNKMKYSGLLMTIVALVNVGLNFWLIPRFGIQGAATAALASYGMLFVALLSVNLRFWHIPYEYGRVFKVALVWITVFASSTLIDSGIWWIDLFGKVGVLGLYPLLLLALRFPTAAEWTAARAALVRR